MSDTHPEEVVEHLSPFPADETVARLTEAIAARGMTVFARIDHAANARGAGLAMPPTIVLLYGNAEGGTPIMQATPLAALDLPLRVLVRQLEEGTSAIAFHPVVAMLRRAGVPGDAAARLAPAQELLLAAVTR